MTSRAASDQEDVHLPSAPAVERKTFDLADARSMHAERGGEEEPSFAEWIRRIRRRVASKQTSLSYLIGCSDAAISLWESGARLPTAISFDRLLAALAQEGATTAELTALRDAWHRAVLRRTLKRRGYRE